MYCRKCGKEVKDRQMVCLSCGFNPSNGEKFCQHCGAETSKGQYVCTKCGFQLTTHYDDEKYTREIQYDLYKKYYQKEFKKIDDTNEAYKGKFNYSALFFSWIWCFVKGLPKQAFTIVVVSLFTCGFGLIVMSVYLGANATHLYYRESKGEDFWF